MEGRATVMRRLAAVMVCVVALSAGMVAAQDPLKTLPKNYWVEFERPWVRVVHVSYHPRELVAAHDHPGPPTLFVYLSDAGAVKFLHTDSDVVDGNRPPVKIGQLRLSPGKAESHRVENMSDQQSDFLRVEFPTVPVGLADMESRMPPASEMFWAMEKPHNIEADTTHVKVTRLGLPAGKSATFKAEKKPGGHTLWLWVRGDESSGATVEGKLVHPGEAWDAEKIAVKAGAGKVELLEVEVR